MKTLCFSLLLVCLLQDTFAQVSGKITINNGQPLSFANVSLLKRADTSIVKSTLTNENGTYRIANISPGIYVLRLSSIGYQTWVSPAFELTANKTDKDFGTIVMSEATRQLGEVVI